MHYITYFFLAMILLVLFVIALPVLLILVVAWLIIAERIAATVRRRPDGARTTAWLALLSLAALAVSIAWGVLGATRHGKPAAAVVLTATVHEAEA